MEIIEKSIMPGPNRRSESSTLEYHFRFLPGFAELPAEDDRGLQQVMRSWLAQSSCNSMEIPDLEAVAGDSWPVCVARRFAQLALLLQQRAGHVVAGYGVVADTEEPVLIAWFEYDHHEVGERAANLALAVIRFALALCQDGDTPALPDAGQWRDFMAFAQGRALPMETRALVAAAARRDIPCFKLDRDPYDPLEGNFRIRPNGLLRLGHSRYSLVLDGTLCVNRNPAQIMHLRERRNLRVALRAVGVTFEDTVDASQTRVLVIGGSVIAVTGVATTPATAGPDVNWVTPDFRQLCAAVHKQYQLPIFAARIAANGAWTELDLSPRLETWFPTGGVGLDQAADLLLQQFYPQGSTYRIPIISVTGTNGKTTTCTMLQKIMLAANRTPVVVSSNGVYVGDGLQGQRRDFGPATANFALEYSAAEVAVLEDYFGSICRLGFAYEWSDVAICTNVTVDHLHRLSVHTLEQMAEVKFAVVARARKGVVLNADNAWCAAMLARATAAQKFAVSLLRERASLLADHPLVSQFCVLEQEGSLEFITIYDGAERLPLVAVKDIPATRNGTARHNISNAMHGASAAWLLGVQWQDIATALCAFTCDFNTCRGRLNEFNGLPFRVIMDYAHNADGFRQVSAFVDSQQVAGRKIITFNYSEDRRQSEIDAAVAELAGHFDLYACGKFRETRQEVSRDMPELLRQALLRCGVSASAVSVAADSVTAQNQVLAQARPGDLVVLLVGSADFESLWQRLEAMRPAGDIQAAVFT